MYSRFQIQTSWFGTNHYISIVKTEKDGMDQTKIAIWEIWFKCEFGKRGQHAPDYCDILKFP